MSSSPAVPRIPSDPTTGRDFVASTWASDVKQWTINLIVDIGDGLDSLMTYVVDDVTSAVHAISSFFRALGADIEDGID
jgi:hypothetical protein